MRLDTPLYTVWCCSKKHLSIQPFGHCNDFFRTGKARFYVLFSFLHYQKYWFSMCLLLLTHAFFLYIVNIILFVQLQNIVNITLNSFLRSIATVHSSLSQRRLFKNCQESASDEQREAGRMPRTIEVELTRDLTDSASPGDVVTITGKISDIFCCRLHLES